MRTWIVVAHRGGARLVDVDDDDQLRVFEDIDFPIEEAVETAAESHHGERTREARDSARGHAAEVFAHNLADTLRQGRNANRYDELLLIAAPRFLGALREALDDTTAARVRGTLSKDYAGLNDRDLLKRLEKM